VTDDILVVINGDAPSAGLHATATKRFQERTGPDGGELPPHPVFECRMIDTSHPSLLYALGAVGVDGKASGVWIPYGHILAIIERVTEAPNSVGFVHH
jgi:hypothetical protein